MNLTAKDTGSENNRLFRVRPGIGNVQSEMKNRSHLVNPIYTIIYELLGTKD